MKPNDVFSVTADDIASGNANDSSKKKPGESFSEEKKPSQKKNSGKNVSDLPAPFYDELHFANYE